MYSPLESNPGLKLAIGRAASTSRISSVWSRPAGSSALPLKQSKTSIIQYDDESTSQHHNDLTFQEFNIADRLNHAGVPRMQVLLSLLCSTVHPNNAAHCNQPAVKRSQCGAPQRQTVLARIQVSVQWSTCACVDSAFNSIPVAAQANRSELRKAERHIRAW